MRPGRAALAADFELATPFRLPSSSFRAAWPEDAMNKLRRLLENFQHPRSAELLQPLVYANDLWLRHYGA
jgi:hypothetical protein